MGGENRISGTVDKVNKNDEKYKKFDAVTSEVERSRKYSINQTLWNAICN